MNPFLQLVKITVSQQHWQPKPQCSALTLEATVFMTPKLSKIFGVLQVVELKL